MIRRKLAAGAMAFGVLFGGVVAADVAMSPVASQAQAHQKLISVYCYKVIGNGIHFSWKDGWHTSPVHVRVYCSGPKKGKVYTG